MVLSSAWSPITRSILFGSLDHDSPEAFHTAILFPRFLPPRARPICRDGPIAMAIRIPSIARRVVDLYRPTPRPPTFIIGWIILELSPFPLAGVTMMVGSCRSGNVHLAPRRPGRQQ